MAFILLTGPSGAGKDWVMDRLKEDDPTINCISFDLIFNYIKQEDFSEEERTNDYSCIHADKSRIIFAIRYKNYLTEHCFNPECHCVVQGYQLTVPEFRDPLFRATNLSPDSSLMIGIFPPADDLRKNRLGGKKYQRDHAGLEQCRGAINHWEKQYNQNLPSFDAVKITSSDEALETARGFLFVS